MIGFGLFWLAVIALLACLAVGLSRLGTRKPQLCEVCGKRPAYVREDGDWCCAICSTDHEAPQ